MSFNNVGHLITSTITILQHFAFATLNHTSPNYTSLLFEAISVLGTEFSSSAYVGVCVCTYVCQTLLYFRWNKEIIAISTAH